MYNNIPNMLTQFTGIFARENVNIHEMSNKSKGAISYALFDLDSRITEETAASALPSVQAAASFGWGMMAMNVVERVFAMLLHIGLTVIVYCGIVQGRKTCLPLAVVLHMLMDTFPALYQRGLVPLWAVEVWTGVWTCIVACIAVKLYRQMEGTSPADIVS